MNSRTVAAVSAALSIAVTACNSKKTSETTEPIQFPEARFPSYLKPVSSVEEVLPSVRPLARNKTGFQGNGLGIAQPGETIVFVLGPHAEDIVVPAVKKWLRERRPDLAEKLFPKNRELSPRMRLVHEKLHDEVVGNEIIGRGIQAYLKKHPEVRGVFWGKAGGTFRRCFMHPMEDKFLGLFIVDNRWDVMSALGTYPGDVWQLVEEQTMEPLIHVDQLRITDPEGTDIRSDISEQQARNWARGAYQRGHLYMFPSICSRTRRPAASGTRFTEKYNLPRDHGFHTHTYFSNYEVHLRNADRWVTLIVRSE